MTVHELRDEAQARTFLLQGLCVQRIAAPTAASFADPCAWILQLLSDGHALPAPAFVADAGHLLLGLAPVGSGADARRAAPPGTDAPTLRAYEDLVLGKLYADASFERAGTAVCRLAAADRPRGAAWAIARIAERAGFDGALLSPGIVRGLLGIPGDQLLAEGFASLARDGLLPVLRELHESSVARMRNLGEALDAADVFELEHGTALAEFGQRLALRQVLQAADHLAAGLPERPPRSPAPHRHVPTHLRDEDHYPVGGFESISTRGTIESLLHSQLALMENDPAARPDLFDLKFLRNELLYYSRDENQFFRRRRTFVVLFEHDLVEARRKDPHLPWQRIVLALALLLAFVRRVVSWLGDESLRFDFLFVEGSGAPSLTEERGLLELLLREEIGNGTASVARTTLEEAVAHANRAARRTSTHVLAVSMRPHPLALEDSSLARLLLGGERPLLATDDEADAAPRGTGPARGAGPTRPEEPDDLGGWTTAARALLEGI